MRVISEWVDMNREQEQFIQQRSNALSVGSADFDYLLKATVGEAYLRALRNGGTPAEAHLMAVADGNYCVSQWNTKTHKTRAYFMGPYELQRWDKAGEAEADAVHLRYLNLIGA